MGIAKRFAKGRIKSVVASIGALSGGFGFQVTARNALNPVVRSCPCSEILVQCLEILLP